MYLKPIVKLLHATPIGVAEVATRICYDSFSRSEDKEVQNFEKTFDVSNIKTAPLATVVSKAHGSIIEHINFTFFIDNMNRGCYSDDTEVLTESGWRLFKEFRHGDKVLTMRDDGVAVFQEPINFIAFNFNGKLHHYENNGIDLLVTDNHRMLLKNSTGMKYTLSRDVEKSKLSFYRGLNYNGGGVSFDIDKDVDTSKFLKFLAYALQYVCIVKDEVYVYYRNKNKDTLINILRDLDIEYKEIASDIGRYDCKIQLLDREVINYLYKDHYSKKFIPFNIFSLTSDEAAQFLRDFKEFNIHQLDIAFHRVLVDDLMLIASIANFNYHVDEEDKLVQDLSPADKVIHYDATEEVYKEVDYDSKVYCLTVDNSNLYVRRGMNKPIWCGNSLQEHVRHRMANISVRSTRYTANIVVVAAAVSLTLAEDHDLYNTIIDERVFTIKDFHTKINRLVKDLLDVVKEDPYSFLSKRQVEYIEKCDTHSFKLSELLELPKKKNVGDNIKQLVDDTWRTTMIWTINARSLKNFLKLRNSGAAWGPMRAIAEEVIKAIPKEYHDMVLRDIDKKVLEENV